MSDAEQRIKDEGDSWPVKLDVVVDRRQRRTRSASVEHTDGRRKTTARFAVMLGSSGLTHRCSSRVVIDQTRGNHEPF